MLDRINFEKLFNVYIFMQLVIIFIYVVANFAMSFRNRSRNYTLCNHKRQNIARENVATYAKRYSVEVLIVNNSKSFSLGLIAYDFANCTLQVMNDRVRVCESLQIFDDPSRSRTMRDDFLPVLNRSI